MEFGNVVLPFSVWESLDTGVLRADATANQRTRLHMEEPVGRPRQPPARDRLWWYYLPDVVLMRRWDPTGSNRQFGCETCLLGTLVTPSGAKTTVRKYWHSLVESANLVSAQ